MSAATIIAGLVAPAIALWLLLSAPITALVRLRRGTLDRRWAVLAAAGYVPAVLVVRLFAAAGSALLLVPWAAALVLATLAAVLVARRWSALPTGTGTAGLSRQQRPRIRLAGSAVLTAALLVVAALPLVFG